MATLSGDIAHGDFPLLRKKIKKKKSNVIQRHPAPYSESHVELARNLLKYFTEASS